MAPAETTANPEHPEPPKVDDKTETAQNSSTDPASADCQQSIDPHMEKSLGECSPGWEYVIHVSANKTLLTNTIAISPRSSSSQRLLKSRSDCDGRNRK